MDQNKLQKILIYALWTIVVVMGVCVFYELSNKRNARKVPVPDSDWGKLMLVLGEVDKDYVEEIDRREVTEKILPILMSELDPHSVYLSPDDLKEADEDLQGGFDGIGVMFNMPDDSVVITGVISGGPSEKAGLLTGDRIVRIDGRDVAGRKFPQDSVVRLLKGKRGTKVIVDVVRPEVASLLPFTITRDAIPVKSVDAAFMIDDTTAYVKLEKFARNSHIEFLKAVAELRGSGMTKMIFDLRGNSGGYLDQALLLCNEFLEKGDLVVYMEGRSRKRQDVFADGRGNCRDLSLAVLIDEGSASSSEIFAGAIQDNDRGTIYGLRSFGKGLVQEPRYFSDGSGIRLTVARYYTPSGRCIQKPYSDYGESRFDDIIARYSSGEMLSVDSIKVNDSLKFKTLKKGRTVYGGGGIIPDVFVPLDTTAVSPYLIGCNRQSLQIKFANKMADRHRAAMREIKDFKELNRFLDGLDLKNEFIRFTSASGVVPQNDDWAVSGEVILTQLRALIARYTPMDDNGFYSIFIKTDTTVQRAIHEN